MGTIKEKPIVTDYIPYGEDWEKEMMRLTKKELIQFIKKLLE